jgi:hypothetical protein
VEEANEIVQRTDGPSDGRWRKASQVRWMTRARERLQVILEGKPDGRVLKNVERTQFDPWKLEGLGFGFVHLVCGKDLDRRHDSFAAPQSDIHAVPRRQCEFARCSVDFGQ